MGLARIFFLGFLVTNPKSVKACLSYHQAHTIFVVCS